MPQYKNRLNKHTILLAKEKHGTRYFHVPTIRALDKVCIKLFKERKKDHHYELRTLSPMEERFLNIKLKRRKMLVEEILKQDYRTDPELSKQEREFFVKVSKVDLDSGNPTRAELDCKDRDLIEFLEKDIEHIEILLKQSREEKLFVAQFKQAMANHRILLCNGYPETFSLLQSRSGHEYERIQLEQMS